MASTTPRSTNVKVKKHVLLPLTEGSWPKVNLQPHSPPQSSSWCWELRDEHNPPSLLRVESLSRCLQVHVNTHNDLMRRRCSVLQAEVSTEPLSFPINSPSRDASFRDVTCWLAVLTSARIEKPHWASLHVWTTAHKSFVMGGVHLESYFIYKDCTHTLLLEGQTELS